MKTVKCGKLHKLQEILIAQLGGGGNPIPPLTRLYHDHDYGQCFGSGSVSGSVDMDPGSAKGLLRQKVYIF